MAIVSVSVRETVFRYPLHLGSHKVKYSDIFCNLNVLDTENIDSSLGQSLPLLLRRALWPLSFLLFFSFVFFFWRSY